MSAQRGEITATDETAIAALKPLFECVDELHDVAEKFYQAFQESLELITEAIKEAEAPHVR